MAKVPKRIPNPSKLIRKKKIEGILFLQSMKLFPSLVTRPPYTLTAVSASAHPILLSDVCRGTETVKTSSANDVAKLFWAFGNSVEE